LSERSRYRRFFSSPDRLPETSIKDLLTADDINRVALCAGVILTDGWEGAGIARFTRYNSNPASAEVALTVIDKYQRQGLGSLLFELLRRKAIECGITQFTGITLADNTSMLKILNHYPIESGQVITGPAIRLDIKLYTDSPVEVITFEYDRFTENHTPIE
jgi:GNAT superfamily N-acetyltransferase